MSVACLDKLAQKSCRAGGQRNEGKESWSGGDDRGQGGFLYKRAGNGQASGFCDDQYLCAAMGDWPQYCGIYGAT